MDHGRGIRVGAAERKRLWRLGIARTPTFTMRVEIVTGTGSAATAGVMLAFVRGRGLYVLVDRSEVRIETLAGRTRHGGDGIVRPLPAGTKTVLDVRLAEDGIEVHASRAGTEVRLVHPVVGARLRTWGFYARETGARFRFVPAGPGK